jgi:cytochrome c-type biogenesis protein CcmH/NrfF
VKTGAAVMRGVATAGAFTGVVMLALAVAPGPARAASTPPAAVGLRSYLTRTSADATQLLHRLLTSIGAISLFGAAPQRGPTTMQDVCEGLTCQCGCGLTVANCNHPTCPFAVPLRTQIDGMIKGGVTRAAIISDFRAKVGEKILSAPTTEGFNILAWTMPFIALIAGAILILVAVGRWRPAAPSGALPASQPPPTFDPRLKKLLERELRDRI